MFTIFVDNIVTLQAGTPMADGHQIEAHKVILAASSPFFQAILKKNKHSHPLIYLRVMKSNLSYVWSLVYALRELKNKSRDNSKWVKIGDFFTI